jgi:YD repeat-containing protein
MSGLHRAGSSTILWATIAVVLAASPGCNTNPSSIHRDLDGPAMYSRVRESLHAGMTFDELATALRELNLRYQAEDLPPSDCKDSSGRGLVALIEPPGVSSALDYDNRGLLTMRFDQARRLACVTYRPPGEAEWSIIP